MADRPIPPNSAVNQRGVQNFPTPVVSDQIIIEYISAETGSYEILAYGTKWDEVRHTSFQVARPGFQLVWQGPVDANGWLIKRVWANDRVGQDSYNAESIEFINEDPDYPDITRVYVYPRDKYNTGQPDELGPLPPLTPDEVYTNCLLVSEKMLNDVQPAELQSKYVKVVRRYMRLPGPVMESQDFDSELDCLVYTDRQLVLSDDVFQPEYEPLTLEMRETPASKYYKLRVKSYLLQLPPSKTEFDTGSFNFPSLIFGITATVTELTSAADSQVIWYPNPPMRGEPNVPALLKIITTFSVNEPSPVTIFVIPSNTLLYRGISYQIAFNNVLNDAFTTTVQFSGDDQYGNLDDSHAFPASALSASQYVALIGTYQNIGCKITRWRGNLWVTQISQILLV